MHANTLTLVLGLVTSLVAPTSAFFRMSCPGRLVRERLDPIVNPGAVSGHLHTISGGAGFGPSMTYAQARSAACSSCEIKEDFSNYWTPQLFYHAQNGSFIPVPVVGDGNDQHGGMTVYYLQRGNSGEKLHAFPEGFRMLAGDPFKRNFTGGLDAQAVNFACLGADKPETNGFPNYNCPGGLRAQLFFPACWNGKDLDSADHKSHMSYPAGQNYNNGPCPADFPVHLVSIFFEVLYDTNGFANEWYGNSQPFVLANGDSTGYGFHGDFVNGWNVNVLQKAVDNCLADSGQVSDCHEVTTYTASECQACRLPSVVNEQVDGWMSALPGCNPVTNGPGPAPKTPCAVTPLSPPETNFVDLTVSKSWEYTGCGSDNYYSRTFTGKSESTNDMTVEKCVDFCSSNGYSYAGLEYSRECYCDNTLSAAAAPKPGVMGACLMKCSGDSGEFCGGGSALSIYHKCSPGSCKNAEFGVSGNTTTPASSAAPVSSVVPSSTIKVASSSKAKVASSSPVKSVATPTSLKSATSLSATSKTSTVVPVQAASTTTKAPVCPRNNCINQITNPTVTSLASVFCKTYTRTVNTKTAAIPTFLSNCHNSPVTVSSACSCLMYSPTATPKSRARRHLAAHHHGHALLRES
ncbi:WSC-domain-containing protein [Cenococcum geophilum 1.58]|uniref:WSC-domain-containing protein n=1 Tax=Cenococcum geophilum 1.58 TaxID=794803 RepID=UPI00358EE5EF|nr:WSC-domain-containing protein [Cenococcum geophilum 1.58]